MNNNIWTYDLEQTVNFHSAIFINIFTDEIKQFVVSPYLDQRKEYLEFIKQKGLILVGFNNIDFDYQLHHILLVRKDILTMPVEDVLKLLYERAQVLTDSTIHRYDKKMIREWEMLIPQLDLYKIPHFDNEAKRTSLKALEVAMRMESVQDMPFKHYDEIHESDFPKVIKYNIHDVKATLKFLREYMMKGIKLRQDISNLYNIKVMNANDIKMGEEIFAKELSRDMNLPTWEVKKLKTTRSGVDLSDCILDKVKFQSNEFQSILDFYKKQYIYSTKSAFSKTPASELGELWNYCAKTENDYSTNPGKVKVKKLIVNEDGIDYLTKLNVIYKGFQYDFGTGGIHGCISPGIYKEDNEWMIVDIDVN